MHELPNVTFTGDGDASEHVLWPNVPRPLRDVLEDKNGFIAFGGALHVRGLCDTPEWHSLDAVWHGPGAFHDRYRCVEVDDVPFAQDCVGDQFLLRSGRVHRLLAESDEIELLVDSLGAFFDVVLDDPDLLGVPLLDSLDSGMLEPGELLMVYPPFCTQEAEEGVHIEAVPTAARLEFLARFAASIRDLDEGEQLDVEITD